MISFSVKLLNYLKNIIFLYLYIYQVFYSFINHFFRSLLLFQEHFLSWQRD